MTPVFSFRANHCRRSLAHRPHGHGRGPAYIPIAAARTQAQGTTLTVLGTVTVPPGDFRSSSDDEGFGNQYDTAYEVEPRSRRDIVTLP